VRRILVGTIVWGSVFVNIAATLILFNMKKKAERANAP
jgi:hypothetical protein